MNEYIERIENAVQNGDTRELKRIIHGLVVIGACDHARAQEILTHDEPERFSLAA